MIDYASEIKKTADGGRSGSGRQTRRNKEVVPQRRFQTDGKVDEQKAAERVRHYQAKEAADKEEILIRTIWRIRRAGRGPPKQ